MATTWAADSTFGSMISSSRGPALPTTSMTSYAVHFVDQSFTRTQSTLSPHSWSRTAAATLARDASFSLGATASSRSRNTMSAGMPGPLPSIFSLEPGMDRHERRGRSRERADMASKATAGRAASANRWPRPPAPPAGASTVTTMAVRVQVVIDCHDPDRLARFWADLLGYQLEPPPEGFDSWEAWLTEHGIPESEWNSASAIVDPDQAGPRIFLQRVPEDKVVKNRVHLDVNAGGVRGTPAEERRANVDAAVEKVVAAGGAKVRLVEERGERHFVMHDPEGNEFCLQ